MKKTENILGYLRYEGELVSEGYMDARKSAQALLGFDEAIRFFIFQQAPFLKKTDFEFPVRVKKGSWEIEIPELINLIVYSGGGIVLTAYGKKAVEKMAENDFDNVGLKDIFQKSMLSILWLIRMGKHIGDLTIKQFKNTKFKDKNRIIGIENSENKILDIPKKNFDLYIASPPKLLANISELVEDQRILSLGVYEEGELIEESVTIKHRRIFTQKEDETIDILFPELDHGVNVELKGEITRGNERSNSLGFWYEGHILTCYPQAGSIVKFKQCLFLKCKIFGIISRYDDTGGLGSRKPKILFDNIEPIENATGDLSLFE